MNLKRIGLTERIEQSVTPEQLNEFEIARVFSVHRDHYFIHDGTNEIRAEGTGQLAARAASPLDFPTVGDWVTVQYFDQREFAIVTGLLPRHSVLKRKSAGRKVEYQLVAANVDYAFLMQSLDDNFNLRRLERYLSMVYDSAITPIILLSKTDLHHADVIEGYLAECEAIAPGVEVIPFSNTSEAGVGVIVEKLEAGKTYCLLGSSGVGKTSLLNNLIGDERFETQSVREKDSRGRHTTTARHIYILENGSLLVDTPGMRELGHIGGEAGIDQTFDEIAEAAARCRFNDCSHTNEKGCAVLDGLEDGSITEERYESYLKISKEAAHNAMSYAERRHKDKMFGRMYKSVVKHSPKK